ncbi:hypothetical protein AX14_007140 [Amanita brunnescens Koide BX004]|nr:hypothetical protein AX14_007140 [Amanita brunnescens Koide BX004]
MLSPSLLVLSQEIVLHIFSYLDLPDLAAVAEAVPSLAALTTDPILHSQRLSIVVPARLKHFLFSTNAHGVPLRPTIGDLAQRGVIRGLNVEQRWRMGQYIYTMNSIKQYENGRKVARRHAGMVVSRQLGRRMAASPNQALKQLHFSHVLPDVESSSLNMSRTLLPIVHKLKWSLQRANLARLLNARVPAASIGEWLEGKGRGLLSEHERVRLAICPDINKMVRFYESLGVL